MQTPKFVSRKLFYLCDPDKLKKYKGYDESGREDILLNSFACDQDMTLGYSLTSLQIGRGNVYIATGGPRAFGLKGMIKIFKFNGNEQYVKDSFTFIDPVIGEEFNSGFGTSIVGADLDGDEVDELVVGEPYRSVSKNSSKVIKKLLLFNSRSDNDCCVIYR